MYTNKYFLMNVTSTQWFDITYLFAKINLLVLIPSEIHINFYQKKKNKND